MEERIKKLLILAGEEAVEHQKRDFGRIVTIIVDQYLTKNEEMTQQIIQSKLTEVIGRVPLKQHLYAGLTAKICLLNKDFSNHLIQSVLNDLEASLSQFQFYQSINILTYLSELMNIALLNSFTFMGILEDILDHVDTLNNQYAKKFYVSLLIRVLPVCIWSLSEKLFPDLKKFMDLLENHLQNDSLFAYLKSLVNRGKIVNFSLMGRLEDKFEGIPQFNFKRKLKIQSNLQKLQQWTAVQYFNLNRQYEDQLYKQFSEEEGRIHQLMIQQLVETFYPRGNILNMKISNYLNSVPSHKQVYLYQFTISTLLSKCLRSPRPIVQQSLLLNIVNNFNEKMTEQEGGNLTKGMLSGMLETQVHQIFNKGQSLDLGMILNVTNLVSFLAVNLKQDWDWQRYLENENTFVKRRVMLSLILEKVKVINDNIVLPQAYGQYSQYQIQEKITNQMQYRTTQEMELFESYEQALKTKTPAEKVKQIIQNQQQYEVFLEALFRRTSLSHTHLKTLIQRYKQVLLAYREWDFSLINKIRNFWKKSYLNRQLYLQTMIKNNYITFGSYVSYINQLKDKDEREMVWIKIELNQLNNLFGTKKTAK